MRTTTSGGKRGETHRGRPRRDEYVRLVASLVRADVCKLDECVTLATYPGVRAVMRCHQHRVLPLGVSLKLHMDRSVADVLGMASIVKAQNFTRMATFLHLWYVEEKPVTEVARLLELERTHVAKTVQRPALELVARCFLYLAEQVDPLSANIEDVANIEDFARFIA